MSLHLSVLRITLSDSALAASIERNDKEVTCSVCSDSVNGVDPKGSSFSLPFKAVLYKIKKKVITL